MMRAALALAAVSVLAAGCTTKQAPPDQTERLAVVVRLPNGDPLPGPGDPPLPLPLGVIELDFDLFAQRADGSPDPGFQGFVRISSVPGSVVDVIGQRVSGRNVLLLDGEALDSRVRIQNARGLTRIWAEDIGYVPGDPTNPNELPSCANGIDDDEDGEPDYPRDPGCAFANDTTENGGTYAAGVSEPIRFERPRLGDVQGLGSSTPYVLESVQVETELPIADLIVTRIARDGFYVTDIAETRGYGHAFAFTFSAPGGLRVCDRITQLAGTASEFFGFTELSFPSFERHAWRFPLIENGVVIDPGDGDCLVPEPKVLTTSLIDVDVDGEADPDVMETLESSLVRLEDAQIGAYFGPEPVEGANGFKANASNCDLDGSGFIDFTSTEGDCANACGLNANCVEWTGYVSRGNYRVLVGAVSLQINTQAVSGFDPQSMRGKKIRSLTGTVRNFSGGALNWTIEARCDADLVCDDPSQQACVEGPQDPVSSKLACIKRRTVDELEGQD